jgi:hypothetical protein
MAKPTAVRELTIREVRELFGHVWEPLPFESLITGMELGLLTVKLMSDGDHMIFPTEKGLQRRKEDM